MFFVRVCVRADYLYELGRQSANMNTDMGAKNSTGMVDILFTGGYLGRDADITSGELRKYEFRTLKHLEVRNVDLWLLWWRM